MGSCLMPGAGLAIATTGPAGPVLAVTRSEIPDEYQRDMRDLARGNTR